MPYRILKTTISAMPRGFPFALIMIEVTPTSDAMRVRTFPLSNMQKEAIINTTDEHHKNISVAEKLRTSLCSGLSDINTSTS